MHKQICRLFAQHFPLRNSLDIMPSPLANIDVLSDDEGHHVTVPTGLPASTQAVVPVPKRMPAKRKVAVTSVVNNARPNVQLLRRRVDGQCGCLCQCFKPFRDIGTFDQLIKVRTQKALLDKLDQDNFALTLEGFECLLRLAIAVWHLQVGLKRPI